MMMMIMMNFIQVSYNLSSEKLIKDTEIKLKKLIFWIMYNNYEI